MKITNREIPAAVAARLEFRANSVTAQVAPSAVNTGILTSDWREILRLDSLNHGISYVVYSYATPIAWVRGDGCVVIPDTRYSVTTSKQQSLVRQGFNTAKAA